MQNKSHRQEASFHIAQFLMMYSSCREGFRTLLQQQLMADNNRSKLAILRVIANITDQWNVQLELETAENIDGDIRIVAQFVPQCIAIASSR